MADDFAKAWRQYYRDEGIGMLELGEKNMAKDGFKAGWDAARKQDDAMKAAMGEEWQGFARNNCPECGRWKHEGHEDCGRGRFFAVLAASTDKETQ